MGKAKPRSAYHSKKRNVRSKAASNVHSYKIKASEHVELSSVVLPKDVVLGEAHDASKSIPVQSGHSPALDLVTPRTLSGIQQSDEYDFTFIPPAEFNEVMNTQLYVEQSTVPLEPCAISGNRIAELGYVVEETINLQYTHSTYCTGGKLKICTENNRGSGLKSTLTLKCILCSQEFTLHTENTAKEKSVINIGAVWGTLSSGSTYGHTAELLACMDIPVMSYYHFKRIEDELGCVWRDSLYEEMEEAGREEVIFARNLGNVDPDGIPWTTVYVDGGWSKRSYGHNYNANSGVAVIIGHSTRKVLYVGVRNKYCSICTRATNKKMLPKTHICFKNWCESSSAMEADIIVEGFKQSIEMHGLRYKKFIGDGDSSVYAKVQQNVSYGRDIQKAECTNHAIKNYGKALYNIKKDTSIAIVGRKQLSADKINELQKAAQSAIYRNAHGDVEELKADLRNSPNHVYDDHSLCKAENCTDAGAVLGTLISILKSSGMNQYINGALDQLVRKSSKLIDNETNNRAELFMAVVARLNSGKRLNLIQRGSFETRAHLATLSYNKGPEWHSVAWRRCITSTLGVHYKKFIARGKRELEYRRARHYRPLLKAGTSLLEKKNKRVENNDYGPNAREPDLSDMEYSSEIKRKLEELQVTETERDRIAVDSIGQFGNKCYERERQYRLTASVFGHVLRRFDHTPCHNLVKTVLDTGRHLRSPAINFGHKHEYRVKLRFAKEHNLLIQDCGLFIHKQFGYLAASPDGLCGDTHLVEVKCLFSVFKKGISLEDAVKSDVKKTLCVEVVDGQLRLRRQHPYYAQIQGQLNIAEREYCYFIVYVGDNSPLFVEEIIRDTIAWEEVMLPKLQRFFLQCILPEIVLNNIKKGKKCLDPPFILDAIKKRSKK